MSCWRLFGLGSELMGCVWNLQFLLMRTNIKFYFAPNACMSKAENKERDEFQKRKLKPNQKYME
jgi:hypothetical protein